MIVLGLAGTPAGGKSTVGRTLAAQGATWIDADQIAGAVLDRDEIREDLVRRFGSSIVAEGGRIDRAKLASLVFGDDDSKGVALHYLESLVHPPTRLEIARRLQAAAANGVPVAVLDVPLLFESGWDLACDEIWCVDAPFELRARRVASRHWDESELRRRESCQLPIDEKKRRSSRCFQNIGTRRQFTEQIETLYAAMIQANRQVPHDVGHCSTD